MKYFSILLFVYYVSTQDYDYKLICKSDCESDFYHFLERQGVIIYDNSKNTYAADYLIMPGFASFVPEGENKLNIRVISKRGRLDSEMSYIYPSLIKNILHLYQENYNEQNNNNIKKTQESQNEIKNKENNEKGGAINLAKNAIVTSPQNKNIQEKVNLIKRNNDEITHSPKNQQNLRDNVLTKSSNLKPESTNYSSVVSKVQQDPKPNLESVITSDNQSLDSHLKPAEEPKNPNNLISSTFLLSPNTTPPKLVPSSSLNNDNILFELPSSIMPYHQLQSIFQKLSGTYYIYTFASACIKCLDNIFYLTKIIPKLTFKLYYTNEYDNTPISSTYFQERTDYQLRHSFFYNDCYKKTEAFIRGRNTSNNKTFNVFYACVKEIYSQILSGEKTINRISYQHVDLRNDMSYLYGKITNTYW